MTASSEKAQKNAFLPYSRRSPTLYSIKAHAGAVPLYFGKRQKRLPSFRPITGAAAEDWSDLIARERTSPVRKGTPRFQLFPRLSVRRPSARGTLFPLGYSVFIVSPFLFLIFNARILNKFQSAAARATRPQAPASASDAESFSAFGKKRFPTLYSSSAARTISGLWIFRDSRYAMTVSLTSV